ncbi:MAG: tol-pal system protein YbgF [Acidobacteriota bacterium]
MNRKALLFLVVAGLCSHGTVYPASKEIIRLQADVTLLQQQVRDLQKSFDSQTAVIKTLVEQLQDRMAGLRTVVEDVKGSNQQTQAAVTAKIDSMGSHYASLDASINLVLDRLSKLSQQLAETKTRVETLDTTSSGLRPGASPAEVYDAAYGDYLKGNYDLAKQGFEEYLKSFPDTDLSDNALYWVGECAYVQRKFPDAILVFQKVVETYPKGDKAPAAALKKAYSLLEMKNNAEGIRELRAVIQKFPYSDAAQLAKDRLSAMGESTTAPSRRSASRR